MQKQLISLRR